jgi:hypothetical protein
MRVMLVTFHVVGNGDRRFDAPRFHDTRYALDCNARIEGRIALPALAIRALIPPSASLRHPAHRYRPAVFGRSYRTFSGDK